MAAIGTNTGLPETLQDEARALNAKINSISDSKLGCDPATFVKTMGEARILELGIIKHHLLKMSVKLQPLQLLAETHPSLKKQQNDLNDAINRVLERQVPSAETINDYGKIMSDAVELKKAMASHLSRRGRSGPIIYENYF